VHIYVAPYKENHCIKSFPSKRKLNIRIPSLIILMKPIRKKKRQYIFWVPCVVKSKRENLTRSKPTQEVKRKQINDKIHTLYLHP